ncbi:DUF6266 family protein [Pedobacter glucosidilyticus]|uniref:DUF6266 family protein n=1 Tax=Pedobacter glucosidilyticus TaxID=1122941 RepID=UPI0004017B27|nr:DUF6266 family protein [Pedobacter glucosidilyticus]
MGKYTQGILGAFTGKIGTVVGASWRGIKYMRSLAAKRGNANATEKQLEQQARFSLITAFLKPVKPLLEIGFKSYAVGKTGYNSAHSYNLKNALTGTSPNLEIDYSMVLLSRGDLPAAAGLVATSTTAGQLNLAWTDNSGKGKAKAGDKLMLVVFCPALAEAVYSIGDAVREDATLAFDVDTDFSGQVVQVYTAWLSEDGKDVSNSKYAGNIDIA